MLLAWRRVSQLRSAIGLCLVRGRGCSRDECTFLRRVEWVMGSVFSSIIIRFARYRFGLLGCFPIL